MGSEDESERDESLCTRCKIQEPLQWFLNLALGFVHHDHWWNHDEYKKNCDEYYKKDGGKSDNNDKIKPLDHRAEEIQAGYNYLPQAHCCNYYVAIKSNGWHWLYWLNWLNWFNSIQFVFINCHFHCCSCQTANLIFAIEIHICNISMRQGCWWLSFYFDQIWDKLDAWGETGNWIYLSKMDNHPNSDWLMPPRESWILSK